MKKKILVVDNHPLILKFMANLLGKEGHQVKTAEDGLSALDILMTYIPDVMFIDLVMPNINGEQLCRIIRKMPALKDTYAVILSATIAEKSRDFTELGADAFIIKGPFNQMAKHVLAAIEQSNQDIPMGPPEEIMGFKAVYGREITKELISAKGHLETILRNISDAIIELASEGRIVFANPAAFSLMGLSEEELLGSKFTELINEDDRKKIEDLLTKVDKGSQKVHLDTPLLINGRQISLSILPIKEDVNSSVMLVLNDISEAMQAERILKREHAELERRVKERTIELAKSNKQLEGEIRNRKSAEKVLKTSQQRLSQIINFLPDATMVIDLGGKVIAWNQAIKNLTGIKAQDMLGKGDYEYAIPFYGERRPVLIDLVGQWNNEMEEKYQYVKREGRSLVSETYDPLVRPGGYLWNKASLLYDNNGEAIGAIESIRDISDRKRAEERMQLQKAYFEGLVDNMPDAIAIFDDNGTVTEINTRFTKMFGYLEDEALGQNISELVGPPDRLEEAHAYRRRITSGEALDVETVRKSKDGVLIAVSLRSAPVIVDNTRIGHFIIYRDISPRKQAEKEKSSLESQLQKAQKMEAIGTLAGGIAHDFNNILGGIMGYAELAKMKTPAGSDVIADLDRLIKSSKRAADLIKQILTISRQHKKEQRPVQVRYIVNEVLKLLRATLPTTIEVREDLAKDTGIVNADPTQMHQVIMNLGTNAGHAMQEDGGVLTVELANVELDDLSASRHLDLNAGSYLRLTVSDTGHGMPSEIMELIFDPYFTTKDTGKGTGLGLSVAQGIVKAHGGTITVYSELGNGTTFHVYLPIIHEAEKEEKEESEQPLSTGSERILFVDDEEVLIEIGSQMLEQLGYEVVTKQGSVEALGLFRVEPDRFDLVITDMTMPHMTGDKLAQELMKIRPDIPVILCTGHSKKISEEKAKEMGIRAFIMKPLVMRNLAETVREALD